MSAGAREARWTVRLSVQLYRRLLVAYPHAFRRQYGKHMEQVFRDCCREATHAEGAFGLWRYWLVAFGDLIVSALAERRREEFRMSRTAWIRLGSVAAIVGGVMAALVQIPYIIQILYSLDDPYEYVQEPPFAPLQDKLWAATPAIWLLFALALIGLRVCGEGWIGALGRIGNLIGIIGVALVGMGDALIATMARNFVCMPPTCTFYDPHYLSSVARMAVFTGAALFLSGMALYSGDSVRRHTLAQRWGNIVPLLLGVLGLLSAAMVGNKSALFSTFHGNGVVARVEGFLLGSWDVSQVVYSHPGSLHHTNVSVVETLSISQFVFIVTASLLFAIAWMLLGRLMWPGKQEEPVAQVGQVEPAAG